MSKFFCNGADAECSCPILCGDCKSADWTGGTKIKTNADHIRSMTDDELVELLSKPWCENYRLPEECARFDTDCEACVTDWLKRPYKEDT